MTKAASGSIPEKNKLSLEFGTRYKSIDALNCPPLPSVTVLTGLNGSGKSHLLQSIQHGATRAHIDGDETVKPETLRVLEDAKLLATKEPSAGLNSSHHDAVWNALRFAENDPALKLRRLQAGRDEEDEREAELQKERQLSEFAINILHGIERRQIMATPKGGRQDPAVAVKSALQQFQLTGTRLVDLLRCLEDVAKKPILSIERDEFDQTFPTANQFARVTVPYSEWFAQYRVAEHENNGRKLESERDHLSTKWLAEEEFLRRYGPPPWQWLNEEIEKLGLAFRFLAPSVTESTYTVQIASKNGSHFGIDDLSSGERVILGMLASLGFATETDVRLTLPKLWLLDEPDAHLHPSFVTKMLKLFESVAKQRNLHVIFTTHSPCTVALAPEGSVHVVDNEEGQKIVRRVPKDDALAVLSAGLPTLSVRHESRRTVLVEGKLDVSVYESVYRAWRSSLATSRTSVSSAHLGFVPSAGNHSGDCETVRQQVKALRENGNDRVWGIVDWDGRNRKSGFVHVLAEGQAYAIENLLVDPIFIAALMLNKNKDREKISTEELGLPKGVRTHDVAGLPTEVLQKCLDTVILKTFGSVAQDHPETVDVEYLGGLVLVFPKWYLEMRGHDLEMKVVKEFPGLKEYGAELKEAVCSHILFNHPELIPSAFVQLFQELEGA